jgi:hypothetical protein
MAKRYSKRASKKRAYKKRSTIRKLKTTLRRKIQRGGGNPAEVIMIRIMLQFAPHVVPIILSLINLGNLNLLMDILMLFSLLGGKIGGSRSNNRQPQRGGGVKENVVERLKKLKIKFVDKPGVPDCIETIIKRIELVPEQQADSIPAADSTTDSLAEDLANDTGTTSSDKVDLSTDTQLQQQLQQNPQQATQNPQQATLPPTVEEAAKNSIINKMITLFNERIKNKISGKIDRMIENIRSKVGNDVIACLKMLKAAIVEDIVSQIKDKMGLISSNILSKVSEVMGGLFQFLVWSAVQIAMGNHKAILTEGGKLALTKFRNVLDAAAKKEAEVLDFVSGKGGQVLNSGREMANNAKEMFSRFSGNKTVAPIDNATPPPSQSAQSAQTLTEPSQSQSAPSSGLFGKLSPKSWGRS